MTRSLISLKVKAKAQSNAIGNYIEINGKNYLQLSIQAVPIDGKANKEIIDFLANEWKIAKINLEIIRGSTSNFKILAIKNIEPDYLNLILKHYIK